MARHPSRASDARQSCWGQFGFETGALNFHSFIHGASMSASQLTSIEVSRVPSALPFLLLECVMQAGRVLLDAKTPDWAVDLQHQCAIASVWC